MSKLLDLVRDGAITFNPIAEPVAKSVTLDVTHALQYVHSLGIAHRDLKPSVRLDLASCDAFSLMDTSSLEHSDLFTPSTYH